MNNDELAIIVSIASFCVAGIALGWNIYRDVILKARVRVTVKKGTIASEVLPPQDYFILSAVNLGPGVVNLSIITFKHSTLWQQIARTWRHGVLIHDYKNPMSGDLPKVLNIGDSTNYIFPWDEECVCNIAPTHIGIADSFGRTHWAPKKSLQAVIRQWNHDFGGQDV